MLFFGKDSSKDGPEDAEITVPARVQQRARKVIGMTEPRTWIDQTLYLIGFNVTHHKPGDPMLDEAIQSAEALLALLVEMARAEEAEGLL
jgi:hypothetical protein